MHYHDDTYVIISGWVSAEVRKKNVNVIYVFVVWAIHLTLIFCLKGFDYIKLSSS